MAFNDARTYQILFLLLFLALGMATRNWSLQLDMIVLTIATCAITQSIMAAINRHLTIIRSRQTDSTGPNAAASPSLPSASDSSPTTYTLPLTLSPSCLITALGLSLLLRADHYSTIVLASIMAISSKFLLQLPGKHLFNPANFGIIVALTLTPDAWVSPGQWGEEGWYALLFLTAGGIVLKRVGRWDTTVAFLTAYAGLEACRNAYLGWTWDVWTHRLMNGSLLLFALFMMTDPRTIPNSRIARLIWAIAIAVLTFVLRNVFFIPTAVFWALFALSPLTILLDILLPADRFSWQPISTSSSSPASSSLTPSSPASPPLPLSP